jgi:hypothetical protein
MMTKMSKRKREALKQREHFVPLPAHLGAARDEGRRAFREGLGEDACPYGRNDGERRHEWRIGYEKAKKEDDEKFR